MRKVALLMSVVFFALLLATAFLVASSSEANAAVDVVCFNDLFQRKIGQPRHETNTFPGVKGPATVKVYNGDGSGWLDRANFANVLINGKVIFRSTDFNKRVKYLQAQVNLLEGNNTVDVNLLGLPGVKIKVEVVQSVQADGGAVVGLTGGIVEVKNPNSPIYGAKVEIPNGAIADLTIIKITAATSIVSFPDGHDTAGVGIKFEPEGIKFSKPIFVSLPLKTVNLSQNEVVEVGYFNETLKKWEFFPPLGLNDQHTEAYFFINHFSIYQNAKLIITPTSVSLPFDFKKDTFIFDNDIAEIAALKCPYTEGVCAGIISIVNWYYQYIRDPLEGDFLRCIYSYKQAANLSCPAQGLCKNLEQGWIDLLINPNRNINDFTQLKNWTIKELKNQKPVHWTVGGKINGKTDKYHSVLVIAWKEIDSSTGKFYIYDPNDNGDVREIDYKYDSQKKIGKLLYSQNTFDLTTTTIDRFFVDHLLEDVDVEKYYTNIQEYPRTDVDGDGVGDSCEGQYGCCDKCVNTPIGEIANANGCSVSQSIVELELPKNNAVNIPTDFVDFNWKRLDLPNESSLKYFISVKLDSNPNDIIFFEGLADYNNVIRLFGFLPGKKYYWAVWAVDQNGVWSKAPSADQWFSFKTIDPNDSDGDGDGFSKNQGDCDDNNPNIYPGSPEICGDGIDNNCNGQVDEGCQPINAGYSVMTQNFEGTNFFIAVAVQSEDIDYAEFISGNYILSTWENHVQLSQAPQIGDQYSIRIHYKNGTTKDFSYNVAGINNNFVSISTPDECEVVVSNNFPIIWQAAEGTVSSYSIIITDEENNTIWMKPLDSSITSVNYNSDGDPLAFLVPGKIYFLHINSYDQNGNSATVVSKFVFNKMVIPTGLSGRYESANGFNRIRWNTNNCAMIYRLYWGTESGVSTGSEFAGETREPVFTHTGVLPGYTYYYKVSSVNIDGVESDLSSEVQVLVNGQPNDILPPSITEAYYDRATNSNWISWSGIYNASNYKLYWGTQAPVSSITGQYAGMTPNTVFQHTGVMPGSTYFYCVSAVNSSGAESPTSFWRGVAVPDPNQTIPNIPANLNVVYESVIYHNYITWDLTPGAREYHVYWSTTPTVSKSSNMLTPTNDTKYYHTGVQRGYTYYYRIAAWNSFGESELSEVRSAYVQ